jgi:hypothetical protein
METKTTSEFEQLRNQQGSTTFLSEFWGFLRYNKKWWLLPIVIVLLLLGVLVALSSTAVAPFIYALF